MGIPYLYEKCILCTLKFDHRDELFMSKQLQEQQFTSRTGTHRFVPIVFVVLPHQPVFGPNPSISRIYRISSSSAAESSPWVHETIYAILPSSPQSCCSETPNSHLFPSAPRTIDLLLLQFSRTIRKELEANCFEDYKSQCHMSARIIYTLLN